MISSAIQPALVFRFDGPHEPPGDHWCTCTIYCAENENGGPANFSLQLASAGAQFGFLKGAN